MMFTFIIVIVIMMVLLFMFTVKAHDENDNKFKEYNTKIDIVLKKNDIQSISKWDFINIHNYPSYDGNPFGKIFLSENKNDIYFIDLEKDETLHKFNYRDILESHIIEDGISITKTSRASQVGGAVIGGALAGGLGMAVGALSGKQKKQEKVQRIELVIIVNDEVEPVRKIVFLDRRISINKNMKEYKDIHEKVYSWHKTISVLINKGDKESKQTI